MVSREGLSTILGLFVFGAAMGWIGLKFDILSMLILSGISGILLTFSVYFFRDPKRVPLQVKNGVVSPADGIVLEVETVQEKEFIQGEARRIAIFLSLFDVHVNYVPFGGTVDYIRYNRGSYKRANKPDASKYNANILTGIDSARGKIVFKQSAGMIARRLVNHLRLDDKVKTGQKFGMIKFGSRMEVYLPTSVHIKVSVGDRVRACESIIAEFDV
ncbi:phosphatidylserine decarboxylase family protein [candidate division KSB1 bacterium]|nr:phosphatidylserine decarboxylase family protein [candidate division KSB1 bacterium]RQW01660.1 MAG: phosphatidylserine decarboxylase family protein [candidate division KSB1 bacterium]